jgi:hypothetical protein
MVTGMPGTDPVLLVGTQRSGTTALGVRLNLAFRDAGGLFTVNGKLMYYLKRWWIDAPVHRHARADEVLHGLRRRAPLGEGIQAWMDRTETVLREQARRRADEGAGDVLEAIRALCRSAYGVPLWGDKYNEYLLDLDFLHALFPCATWVFIARHPAEVVASMLSWSGDRPWNPVGAGAAALKWMAWNREWLRFRTALDPARRVELLYHEVAKGGHGRLSARLGMDLAPYMVDFVPRPCSTVHSIPWDVEETWEWVLQACRGAAEEERDVPGGATNNIGTA